MRLSSARLRDIIAVSDAEKTPERNISTNIPNSSSKYIAVIADCLRSHLRLPTPS